MSALSRRKGRVWQAELAKRWRDSGLFAGAMSTQGAQKFGIRMMVPDVDGTPYWCEAKHTRACNPIAALRQALKEASGAQDERAPIAVCKPSGDKLCGPVVVMRLEDWETLVRLAQYGGARAVEAAE